jgi:hypothetical protein
MAPRAELPGTRSLKHLKCQTAVSALTDIKCIFLAVANRNRPLRKLPFGIE